LFSFAQTAAILFILPGTDNFKFRHFLFSFWLLIVLVDWDHLFVTVGLFGKLGDSPGKAGDAFLDLRWSTMAKVQTQALTLGPVRIRAERSARNKGYLLLMYCLLDQFARVHVAGQINPHKESAFRFLPSRPGWKMFEQSAMHRFPSQEILFLQF
jgi:hypothetical protein